MPLLMSSRMTSAGLTPSSSASSLTVIVAGSSTAPRSAGSMTWTADCTPEPSRRGGLRGPRRPRVPLLLLAIGCPSADRAAQLVGEVQRHGGVERAGETALAGGARDAGLIVANIGSAAVCLARRVVGDVGDVAGAQ